MTESELIGALVMRLQLSRSQASILAALYRAKGRVISDDGLRAELYPVESAEPETNVIKVFIYQLRQKFGPADIVYAHGCGYALSSAGIARVDEIARQAA